MFKRFTKFVPLALALLLVAATATAALAARPNPQSDQTVVDIAVNDGRFTTLVTALQAADLVGTLGSDGPFTVFAPTDDAFAALPEGTVDALLGDIPALTDVLLYHVVPGKVMAADVVNLETANTLQGSALNISVDGNTVKINDAQVIITDIEASNGVIHVIDAVLVPSSGEEEPASEPEMSEPQAEASQDEAAEEEDSGDEDGDNGDAPDGDDGDDDSDAPQMDRAYPPIFAPYYGRRYHYGHGYNYAPVYRYYPRSYYRTPCFNCRIYHNPYQHSYYRPYYGGHYYR